LVLSLAFGIQALGAETRNLFVADQTAGLIVVFSPSGAGLGIFASGLNWPLAWLSTKQAVSMSRIATQARQELELFSM